MGSIRCLKCGGVNDEGNTVCGNCGNTLLKGQEYEAKASEIKDYKAFRKRFSVSGIIIATLILLMLWPLLDRLISYLLSVAEVEALPPDMMKWIAPTSTLIALLAAIPPMVYRRWKVGRKHGWTSERMHSLDEEIKALPREFFAAAPSDGTGVAGVTRRRSALPALLTLILVVVVLIFMENYTEYKPISTITSMLNLDSGDSGDSGDPGGIAAVSGRYECHYSQKDLAGGAQRVDQTWAYVFRSNGTYTTYVNGSQQYSGTWSQSGRTLTIKVPALPGGGPARTGTATVSRDASYFTTGEGDKYVRVK